MTLQFFIATKNFTNTVRKDSMTNLFNYWAGQIFISDGDHTMVIEDAYFSKLVLLRKTEKEIINIITTQFLGIKALKNAHHFAFLALGECNQDIFTYYDDPSWLTMNSTFPLLQVAGFTEAASQHIPYDGRQRLICEVINSPSITEQPEPTLEVLSNDGINIRLYINGQGNRMRRIIQAINNGRIEYEMDHLDATINDDGTVTEEFICHKRFEFKAIAFINNCITNTK
jgi:hypothetical protein